MRDAALWIGWTISVVVLVLSAPWLALLVLLDLEIAAALAPEEGSGWSGTLRALTELAGANAAAVISTVCVVSALRIYWRRARKVGVPPDAAHLPLGLFILMVFWIAFPEYVADAEFVRFADLAATLTSVPPPPAHLCILLFMMGPLTRDDTAPRNP